jgi:subtilisin family serine protease
LLLRPDQVRAGTVSRLRRVSTILLAALAAGSMLGGSAHGRSAFTGDRVEVVLTLKGAQAPFLAKLRSAFPDVTVRWRYHTVLNGVAVLVPDREVDRVSTLPGIDTVYRSVRYREKLNSSPQAIGAPDLWGPTLATAGDGIKIAIVDDGVDQTHPFFAPAGYTMPAGFPKGQTQYTTAKVIVARSFPPAGTDYKNAALPFDPGNSFHATHVAGIAAGNNGTRATLNGQPVTVSGVAPRAYIGNYKVLTIPTPGFGLDGNSPEIAAAIEAAVNDGMNVINLSLGEPEVEPTHDLVVKALEGAAAAGVVPVVAAGNDFADFGGGSVGSPGNAPSAITVAAASKTAVISSFSSGGPTPISDQMKPDVTAPGADILSSVPPTEGTWSTFSGTSMASPHIAGGAALLKQRHPTWTVAQVKSALVQTGGPAYGDSSRRAEATTTREGGGFVNLPRADNPLLFAAPTGLSFGLVKPGAGAQTQNVTLTDAGTGAGVWTVSLAEQQTHDAPVSIAVPASVTVPGTLGVTANVGAGAAQGEHTGFVVLTRGADTRRIPYWFLVETPQLSAPVGLLARPGVYKGNTARGKSRVSVYRYPDNPSGVGLTASLPGPEQVYRVHVSRPVANFGVAVTSGGVEPRVVAAGDENRLVGYAGLPLNINPYSDNWGKRAPVAGAILPAAGSYDVVFDETGKGRPFSFRYWIDDTKPPTVKLQARAVKPGGTLLATATDVGSGVDPAGIRAKLDNSTVVTRLTGSTISISIPSSVAAGSHTLVLGVADYQEAKNMENVAKILPNTRVLTARVTVG